MDANVNKKGRENNKYVKYFSFVLRLFHLKMKIRLWQDRGSLLLWRIVGIEAIVAIVAIVGIVAMGLWSCGGNAVFWGKRVKL